MKRRTLFGLLVLILSIGLFAYSAVQKFGDMDASAPVISMDTDVIEASIYDGDEVLLAGVSAVDSKDGDVTDSLVVESLSEFIDGYSRLVNYAAFDSDNHVSKAYRKVTYTDYTPIQVSVSAPFRFPVSGSSIDVLAYVTAYDCIDGDISDKIRMSSDSSVEIDLAGDYEIELQVTNSVGDTLALPVTVTIYDQTIENQSPKIALSEYLIYVEPGETIDAISYVESVTISGTTYELTSGRGTYGVDTSEMDSEELAEFRDEDPALSSSYIKISNPVDTSTTGTYEITYQMEDEDGNTGSVRLIVIVQE